MQKFHANVTIVGAGTCGAFLGLLLAKAGIKTMIIDQQAFGKTGATWVNGIPNWMLKEADFGPLKENEIFSKNEPFTILSPKSKSRITLTNNPIVDVNMRKLTKRIIRDFKEIPSTMALFNTHITSVLKNSHGRIHTIIGTLRKKTKTKNISIRSDLFVDASGMKAVLRKKSNLNQFCKNVKNSDICLANQEIYSIKDKFGALNYLEKNLAIPTEVLATLGVNGGFSLFRTQFDQDLEYVSFLTGTKANQKGPHAKNIVTRFVKKNKWLKSRISGGSKAIPIRRPYTYLVTEGLALIGDAACQIYPAHASGIGISLIAAKQLAQTVIKQALEGKDIGSITALWPYALSFHQNYTGNLTVSESFCKFTGSLSKNQIHTLIENKILTKTLLENSLAQKPMGVHMEDIPQHLQTIFKHFSFTKNLAKTFYKTPAIMFAAKKFPKKSWQRSILPVYEHTLNNLSA